MSALAHARRRRSKPHAKHVRFAPKADIASRHVSPPLRAKNVLTHRSNYSTSDRCASNCRYCFRKRIVGKNSDEVAPDFAQVGRYVADHPEMNNVLLSGGDPFVLSTRKLNEMLDHLLPIPHLNSIRFGTKAIAFAPRRFEDPALPAMFRRIHNAGKAAVIVAHFDHIGEISADAERNIRNLRAHGVRFLNQSVLLAKVNDDAEIMAATFAKCHAIGVRPYYLFQGRPVKAASHFQIPRRRGGIIRPPLTRAYSRERRFCAERCRYDCVNCIAGP